MPRPHEPTPIAGGRTKVLVVHEDKRFGTALAYFLEDRGYSVRWVATGREALGRAGEFHPDHVVAELGQSGMQGFEFLDSLTALKPRPGVLVCTRQPLVGSLDATTRRRLGIDGVVVRPCRLEAIHAALAALRGPPAPRDSVHHASITAPTRTRS